MNIDEKAEALRRDYYRRWREKPENKDKVREYSQRYWQKKAQGNLQNDVKDECNEREKN